MSFIYRGEPTSEENTGHVNNQGQSTMTKPYSHTGNLKQIFKII